MYELRVFFYTECLGLIMTSYKNRHMYHLLDGERYYLKIQLLLTWRLSL